jgi:hypothetical protein
MGFSNGVDGVKVCGGQDTLFMHMGVLHFTSIFVLLEYAYETV